jgi:succinate dehydrogenase / fumarate reductase flavoprotein subunit
VFGKRAGDHAAQFAAQHALPAVDAAQADDAARTALAPFARHSGESPYDIQHTLQATMQDLVGIVRREEDMQRALTLVEQLQGRAARVAVEGNREYNPGWHTALDLRNLLTVAEAIARSAIARRESRGGHFREDLPDKDPALGKVNLVIRRDASGQMTLTQQPIRPVPPELQQVITEMG